MYYILSGKSVINSFSKLKNYDCGYGYFAVSNENKCFLCRYLEKDEKHLFKSTFYLINTQEYITPKTPKKEIMIINKNLKSLIEADNVIKQLFAQTIKFKKE